MRRTHRIMRRSARQAPPKRPRHGRDVACVLFHLLAMQSSVEGAEEVQNTFSTANRCADTADVEDDGASS